MKIKLSKDLYKKRPIEKTCKVYQQAGLGEFELVEKKNYFFVEVSGVDKKDQKEVKNEFLNYVISESQSEI